MPILRTPRPQPLAVAAFVVSVALAVAVVWWRSAAVADDEARAVASAEGHFVDIVADTTARIDLELERANLVLQGLAATVPDDTDAFDAALVRFGAAALPGYQGAVAVTGSGDVIADDPMLAPAGSVADVGTSANPELDLVQMGDRSLVVVTVAADDGGTRALLFDPAAFLLGGGHGGHHVQATLSPPAATSPVTVAPPSMPDSEMDPASADMPDADMHDADMHDAGAAMPGDSHGSAAGHSGAGEILPDVTHLHADEIVHEHASAGRFRAERAVDVLGEQWELTIASGADFIEPVESREIPWLIALGAVLVVAATAGGEYVGRSRRRDRAASRAAQARFAVGFERSPIGVLELDGSCHVVAANAAAVELFDAPDLVGRPLIDLFAPSSAEAAVSAIERAMSGRDTTAAVGGEVRLAGEQDQWVVLNASRLRLGSGEADGFLVQMIDVTRERHARSELQRRAVHDDLTGLPNRSLLTDRLEQALVRSRRNGTSTAVLFLDLDGFKLVNDTRGHRAGDEVLRDVARRLVDASREEDTVARFGGDEFVVLCADLQSPGEATEIAKRLRRAVVSDGGDGLLDVSIGVAVAGPADDAEAVVRDADLAMYEAKAAGRGRHVVFESGMREELLRRLGRDAELKTALSNEEFEVYYQPLYDLSLDEVVGFEALARWNHPTDGVLAPAEFLPAARRLGLVADLDRFVMERAVRTVAAWGAASGRGLSVAVNAGPETLIDPTLPERVEQLLEEVGLAPELLTVEVTEEEFIHRDEAAEVVDRLRLAGVRVAIDDFGTGHSSFSQVAALEFDVLKIDRSLIQQLGEARGGEIVRTVIEMARGMGVATVAEGVEDGDDLDVLREIGGDLVQGYYIGRPAAAAVVAAQLGLHDRTAH